VNGDDGVDGSFGTAYDPWRGVLGRPDSNASTQKKKMKS
jgi:hypothetical protein